MALVSVIMTAYNAQNTIFDSINSIISQTFSDFEFFLINDGSTDKTSEIIKQFKDPRIIYIDQENNGPSISRDRAIRKSNGKYIAILDADDIALPRRLEKQVDFLSRNEEYILVGSNAIIIDKNDNYIYTSSLATTWEEIKNVFPFAPFIHSSVMFTAQAYHDSGGYHVKDKLFIFEDSLLWNEMKNYGKMVNLEEPLVKYRLLPNAASAKSGKEAMLIKKIFLETISENRINEKNLKKLKEIKANRSSIERQRIYNLFLGRKLLFNNYTPIKSRQSILNAIRINPFRFSAYLLLMLTFLPKSLVLHIHKKYKSM